MPTGRTSSGGFVGDQLANLIGLPEFQGAALPRWSFAAPRNCSGGSPESLGTSTKLIKASDCSVQTICVLYNRQGTLSAARRDFSSTEVSMRLCRFGKNRLGLVRADSVIDVTPVLDRLPSYRYPLPRHDQGGAAPEGEYPRSDHRCAGAHRLRNELLYLDARRRAAHRNAGGVGPIRGGDVIRSAICGIGEMTTLVRG